MKSAITARVALSRRTHIAKAQVLSDKSFGRGSGYVKHFQQCLPRIVRTLNIYLGMTLFHWCSDCCPLIRFPPTAQPAPPLSRLKRALQLATQIYTD